MKTHREALPNRRASENVSFESRGHRYVHGHAALKTPEYRTWCGIRRRCLSPKDRNYPNYVMPRR